MYNMIFVCIFGENHSNQHCTSPRGVLMMVTLGIYWASMLEPVKSDKLDADVDVRVRGMHAQRCLSFSTNDLPRVACQTSLVQHGCPVYPNVTIMSTPRGDVQCWLNDSRRKYIQKIHIVHLKYIIVERIQAAKRRQKYNQVLENIPHLFLQSCLPRLACLLARLASLLKFALSIRLASSLFPCSCILFR